MWGWVGKEGWVMARMTGGKKKKGLDVERVGSAHGSIRRGGGDTRACFRGEDLWGPKADTSLLIGRN